MSNVLSAQWQLTTISIINDLRNGGGTGVLIAATHPPNNPIDPRSGGWDRPISRAYLATARHVLGANASEISSTIKYGLRYNAVGPHGLERREADFIIENDPRNWALHPDESVDVAALDVTSWLADLRDPCIRFCPLNDLANPLNLLEVDCDGGDDVFVLGYPLRLRQGSSNMPIIRKGVLASSPRRALAEEDGTALRGFLVDGAIMPGSSGSPVVSASTMFRGGDLATTPHRPLLIGIVVEEWGRGMRDRYDAQELPVGRERPAIEGYANLGFAHSASTIIETIVQFGHHSIQDFLRHDHDRHWTVQLGVPEWAIEFDGREVDSTTAHRIMMRLYRDRMRSTGKTVRPSDYLDAPEIMGPLRS